MLLFNIIIILYFSYISGPDCPNQFYKCEIKTEAGNLHTIVFNSDDFENNFKKVHTTIKKQAIGDIILYKSFDNHLWIDFVLRLLVDQRDTILKQRPARNIGLAFSYLQERSFHTLGRLNLDDIEMVYPHVVYNGYGDVKSSPIHTLVPEAFPAKCEWMTCSKFIPSGLKGSISLFLPPNTARTAARRKQQQLALIGVLCKYHFLTEIIFYSFDIG